MKQLITPRFFLTNILLLLFTSLSFGQSYKISGVVKDSAQTPLSSATIYIESAKDSTVINYTITGGDGKFSLDGKTNEDQINFYISYTGFQNYHKRISLTEEPTVDLGNVVLKEMNNALGEIIIQGEAPPIKIKKDTLEFNVSSFKTKEDANLEDLLKKLPGVTVDNDGSIKVNGKDVTKIKVNGKDFFGSDPKIATKNLPKDILEKVQIVDSKTKSQEFTGEESDSEDKTINLTIKEENNKGLFARMTAGAGTDHRYSLNGVANYFKNDLRLSALGSSNNINSIGFSFDEIYDAMGRTAFTVTNRGSGGNLTFGSGSGITKSQAGGLDFVNNWGETTDLSANYFYNRASTETATKVERENILPDRQYFNNSNSTSKNVNNNHRGNAQFEYEPDTLTRISIHPNITANNGYSESNSYTESTELDGTQLNNSTSKRHSDVRGVDFSNRVDFTRKFGDKGGYYRVGFDNQNNTQKKNRYNYTSRNIFDENGDLESNEIQDQRIDQDRKADQYTVSARARLPISKEWKLDLNYRYKNTKENNERLVYETPDDTDQYNILNEDLSSNFKSRSFQHRPSAGLVYRGEKITSGLTGGLESVQLKNDEEFTETKFDNTFNNLFASFYMRYRLNQMSSVYVRYRNSRSIPSYTQLQPVSNTLDPLNIITGNPDLKPSLTNSFSLNYYNFNFKSHFGVYAYVRGNYNTDETVSKTTTDQYLVRNTTYTNVDGSYNLSGGLGMHKEYKLKDGSTLKPRIRFGVSKSKDIGFSNAIRYHSDNFSLRPNVSLEYDVPDIINIEPSYGLSYNNTDYSLNSQRNQDYINHDLRLRITSYWPENFIFGNDITYTHIGETAPGFDNDYLLWNMSLGYKIMEGNGIFKVKVFDVLNQNVSTRRSTGQDYIQDTQEMVLKRYMMFSFTYKLSKFGGKKSGGRGYRMH